MNIPRILGHVLNYCYVNSILYDQKITKRVIEDSAQKYYENQIKYYFEKTNYLKEAHDEKLDRFTQQQLVKTIVEKAKNLKTILKNEKSELFKDLPANKIPTSHFFVNKEMEKFLNTLELNYFVNKYYEQSDRDGKVSSVYALNYGLCMEQNILFGRPKGDSKYRKYYISRYFNNNELIENFLKEQKTFICSNCSKEYDYSTLPILQGTGMMCYDGCTKKGVVKEVNKFDSLELLKGIQSQDLLPEVELNILYTLKNNENTPMYASLIAKELDNSYQLVYRRADKLCELGLATKLEEIINGSNKKVYKLTNKAYELYFKNNE